MDIIQYLLSVIKHQHQQICWLLNFIYRYIPLKPVQCRNGKTMPEETVCPLCGAPHHFIYDGYQTPYQNQIA